MVVDIFSGSNTTGYVAEDLQRHWLSIEINRDYASLSAIRFTEGWDLQDIADAVKRMERGESLSIHEFGSVAKQMRFVMETKAQGYLDEDA